jgi:DNA-binding MarR family transcriptional regulator
LAQAGSERFSFESDSLDLGYLDNERLALKSLDVKRNTLYNSPVTKEDHIDRFLRRLDVLPPDSGIDLEVEALVGRINGISRRIKRGMEGTLAEFDLTSADWHMLTALRLAPDHRSSPGVLAADLEVSSGAMTSRLDRLESAGLIRRLADTEDRRGVVVELTPAGRAAWDTAAGVQGRREAFYASALTKPEQRKLNDLLRKLMLAFEEREGTKE